MRSADRDEEVVAGRVAEAVVDGLEVVEVEEQRRQRARVRVRAARAASACSTKRRRLASPVSGSWKAW